MDRKLITIESSKGYKTFSYNTENGRLDFYSHGLISGSYDGKAGSASSLSDAVELAKALAGGSNQKVEIKNDD